MGTVNLPTPVVIAGAALCGLGGYLIGVVAGPDTPDRTTGVVDSYERSTSALCLSGDTVADQEGASEDGQLCGTWRRGSGSREPEVGDEFRFVSVRTSQAPEGVETDRASRVLIYGDVVD